MRLIDGANAIAGDLPSSATTVVDIPVEAGESLDTGVHRYSSLVTIKDAVNAVLRRTEGTVVTIGGDCAADLASVEHALSARESGRTAVVWLDAHADINSAESSPSGAFHGMIVRALLGDAPAALASSANARLHPAQLILAGTRSLDPGESRYLEETGITVLSPDELGTPDALVAALEKTGATAVYLHIDLDVLDPAAINGIGYPEPFGVQPEALTAAIRSVRSRFDLAGAAITEFAPESADAAGSDLTVILRILGALTGPLR
jgi:arginase